MPNPELENAGKEEKKVKAPTVTKTKKGGENTPPKLVDFKSEETILELKKQIRSLKRELKQKDTKILDLEEVIKNNKEYMQIQEEDLQKVYGLLQESEGATREVVSEIATIFDTAENVLSLGRGSLQNVLKKIDQRKNAPKKNQTK